MKTVKRSVPVKAVRPEVGVDPDPDWFLVYMLKEILGGRDRFQRLRLYVEGDPPKPETPGAVEESWKEFEAFRKKSRTNYAEQIIGACVDRTTVQGFRTAADRDTDGDKEARRLWDANDLDVKGDKAISDSYTYGRGYLLADPLTKKARHYQPWQALVVEDAAGEPRAGMCVEHNPTEGRDYAYLYLRDVDENGIATGKVYVHIAVRDRDQRSAIALGKAFDREVPLTTYISQRWVWWKTEPTELDMIPLIDFPNRDGWGEFEKHTDVLDRINHMLLQRVVIATMQAFKQRGIKGTFKKTDKNGNEIDYNELFPSDPAALWLLPPDSEIWESGQASTQDIQSAVKDDVRDLASVTRTPMNYFSSDSGNQSATGSELQNDSYLLKIRDRKQRMRGRWRRFMSIMFQINGDTEQRADLDKLDVIWMPSDNVSITDRYSAASQAKALGLSLRTVMREVLNYAPEDIEVAELEMISETLKNAIRPQEAGTTTGANPAQQTPLQQRAASATALATSNGATSRATGATAGRSGQ